MANDKERREPEELGQDPFVERLRPDPSEPPEQVRVLEGLLGDSDREGYWRLYFSRELDNYAEFRQEDVVFSERIPPDQPPFLGLDATRVGIRRDATVEFTRVRTPRPVDEFDLDVRLGAPGGARLAAGTDLGDGTCAVTCGNFTCETCRVPCGQTGDTCRCGGDTVQITLCRGRTCADTGCPTCAAPTCDTCAPTCDTCQTQCGQATCFTCQGQATCFTCQTNCDQPTCRTCNTQCRQNTCFCPEPTDRCPTEAQTHCNTCRCF